MKYKTQNAIVLNKKIEAIEKIYGIENKTYLIANDTGYTLKKILYSNTQLIINGSTVSDINGYYDVQETVINFENIDKIIAKTKFRKSILDKFIKGELINQQTKDILLFLDDMTFINLEQLAINFGFGHKQKKQIIDKFVLTHIVDSYYLRLDYDISRRIFTYYFITTTTESDENEFIKMYSKEILLFCKRDFMKEWMIAFIFLDLYERKRVNEFRRSLRDMSIYEFDDERVVCIFNSMYLHNHKAIIDEYKNKQL